MRLPFTIGEDEESSQLALPTPLSTPTRSGRSVHGWFAEDARRELSLLPDRSVLHTVDEKKLRQLHWRETPWYLFLLLHRNVLRTVDEQNLR